MDGGAPTGAGTGRLVGLATCPLCGDPGARVVLMKTGRVAMTCQCGDCKHQLFARGDGADRRIRALLIGAQPEAALRQPADPGRQAAPGGDDEGGFFSWLHG